MSTTIIFLHLYKSWITVKYNCLWLQKMCVLRILSRNLKKFFYETLCFYAYANLILNVIKSICCADPYKYIIHKLGITITKTF